MPLDNTFRAAFQQLADLASADNPPHIVARAAGILANLLSPANRRHAEIMAALGSLEPTSADNADADEASSEEEDEPL